MDRIKQAIVVEGRDDQRAVLAAVDANIICTHGYGISAETLQLIGEAYKKQGIIIFTDPDHAGKNIRKKITGLCPDALQAFLTEEQAYRDGDIGIENAKPEDIRRALEAAGASVDAPGANAPGAAARAVALEEAMDALGLSGGPGSAERRQAAGGALGIGYANAKSFLKRLIYMNISVRSLEEACRSFTHQKP